MVDLTVFENNILHYYVLDLFAQTFMSLLYSILSGSWLGATLLGATTKKVTEQAYERQLHRGCKQLDCQSKSQMKCLVCPPSYSTTSALWFGIATNTKNGSPLSLRESAAVISLRTGTVGSYGTLHDFSQHNVIHKIVYGPGDVVI